MCIWYCFNSMRCKVTIWLVVDFGLIFIYEDRRKGGDLDIFICAFQFSDNVISYNRALIFCFSPSICPSCIFPVSVFFWNMES